MMDFRAALVLLFLLVAQAACAVIPEDDRHRIMLETIQQLRKEQLQTVLDELSPAVEPANSCSSLNSTELGEADENLTAHHLSAFRCYILKASNKSNVSKVLGQSLKNITQVVDNMESLLSGSGSGSGSASPAREDCSLPFHEQAHVFNYVRCLLQLLDQRLSAAKFSFQ